jgi:hypothetical protein
MDGAPLAYGAPPPSVGVRGPQAGTMMLPTMESGTEPMQPSPFGPGGPGAPGGRASQAVGHVPPPAGVAAFPASSLAMPAPGGAPGATATTAAMAPVGAPPSPVTSPTTGPDPQALAAAAEAQPAGWSLGKLAVAAVLALVLTAGLTFAILTLKGL